MTEPISRKCPICGDIYTADKARLKYGRQTTCSRHCSYILRSQKTTKSRLYFCAVCAKPVKRAPSHVKSKFVFCSPACHYTGRSIGLVERIVLKPYRVTENGRLAWRKAAELRRGILHKPPVSWTCEVCGRTRTISKGDLAPARKLRFCSPECASIGLRGSSNPSWRGGHPGYYGAEWNSLRKLARKLDDYTCQRCGISQKELGKSLDVHHIRPVSSFQNKNSANLVENVVSLCHNCHMLVEWNGIDFKLPRRNES